MKGFDRQRRPTSRFVTTVLEQLKPFRESSRVSASTISSSLWCFTNMRNRLSNVAGGATTSHHQDPRKKLQFWCLRTKLQILSSLDLELQASPPQIYPQPMQLESSYSTPTIRPSIELQSDEQGQRWCKKEKRVLSGATRTHERWRGKSMWKRLGLLRERK